MPLLKDTAEHHHYCQYIAALRATLAAARTGKLSPTWREDRREVIRTNPPRQLPISMPGGLPVGGRRAFAQRRAQRPPSSPPVPDTLWAPTALTSCLLAMPKAVRDNAIRDAQASRVDALAACAELDLAASVTAAWEPYAACGDWRAALDAWYTMSLEVHDRWTRTLPAREPSDDLNLERDLIGVSYHAALDSQSGCSTWKDWLFDRTDQWTDRRRARDYRLALLDYDAPYWGKVPPRVDDPYRGAFGDPITNIVSRLPLHPLPDYWLRGK
ncbi:hypothetical protein [Candidatus Mycobacterium methanotrophicum]|uniref:hypothetical protein n=1 Tax=Candidatus Mycobacterium methanotrophicum TaxID=2943498 RepID=UPI001C594C0B|nr:hypothetical protein [Candidatus Mycobacterium methanotrophicum]